MSDLGNYFKIKSDTRGLNYEKYFSDGNNSKPYMMSIIQVTQRFYLRKN